MGSKTRLSSYCTMRGDNTVNLVTSHKTSMRLARYCYKTKNSLSLPLKPNEIIKLEGTYCTCNLVECQARTHIPVSSNPLNKSGACVA